MNDKTLVLKLRAIADIIGEDFGEEVDEAGVLLDLIINELKPPKPKGKKIYTVYYYDGRNDHNLIVRAGSAAEAEGIITRDYLPTLDITLEAHLMTKEHMMDMEVSKSDIEEMDSQGYHLYDHGT